MPARLWAGLYDFRPSDVADACNKKNEGYTEHVRV